MSIGISYRVSYHLDSILHRAVNGNPPSEGEAAYLLSRQDPREIDRIMGAARLVRERFFGNRIFLYGFIYFSTYCRNHCAFCFYRKTNGFSPRYRKTAAEVLAIAAGLADSGVHLVDLTMGEDPLVHDAGDFDMLIEMTRTVREKTGLPVMVSPGVVPDEVLQRFSADKVDWYALYQETHTPALYGRLRLYQSFGERVAKRRVARELGMLVEDGILLGVGESLSDRAHAITAMKHAGVHQARVMSLVPQVQTPLAVREEPPRIEECLCIAVMRLVMPDRLIPASLDVDGIGGLRMRLDAGANVVTSLIPPGDDLAGVSRSSLDIAEGLRTVPEVARVLKMTGLQAATADEYRQWVALQKGKKAEREGSDDDRRHCRRTAAGFGGCLSGASGRIQGSAHR